MAAEILINDGGAPARILPFVGGETIPAGRVCTMNSSGEIVMADTDHGNGYKHYTMGIMMDPTTSGSVCNLITGRGVVCKIQTAAGAAGISLKMSSTAGQLEDNDAFGKVIAIRLETTTGSGLARCMTAY